MGQALRGVRTEKGSRRIAAAGTHRDGSAQPRSSPPRLRRFLCGSPRAEPLGPAASAEGPVRPPPAHRPSSHLSGLQRSTRSSWSSCRRRRGWWLPTGQTIRGLRPGVRDVRGGVGPEGAEGRRRLEGTKAAGDPVLSPRPAPGELGSRKEQEGKYLSWLFPEDRPLAFPRPPPALPWIGSWLLRNAANRGPSNPSAGRCPLLRRCERALA